MSDETTESDIVERLAILACFAEFSMPQKTTPEAYWARMADAQRAAYRRDARYILAALRGRDWRMVPIMPDDNMITAALGSGAGFRSANGVMKGWAALIETAPSWKLMGDSELPDPDGRPADLSCLGRQEDAHNQAGAA